MEKELKNIIKGCVAGKRKSQDSLYRLFAKKMFGVSLIYTKDYSAAEDVVQEGFIKIFKNIKQYRFKGSFEGWVRRIIVNTALEKFRKASHLFASGNFDDYAETLSYDDVISQISAKELMNIIQELTPQYRVVFSLFAIEGYSHKEIAEELNISQGTSKSNLSRARKILQEKVIDYYDIGRSQFIV